MTAGPSTLRDHMNDPDRIVVYDLEWTSWEGFRESKWTQPGRHREVIQIGAVSIDCRQGFAEVAHFNVLVRPTVNPDLSDYVQRLTGITQDMIERRGVDFADALARFGAFCRGVDLACINGEDNVVIAENCTLYGFECLPLVPASVNLRPLFSALLEVTDGGIDSCDLTDRLGLPSVGARHDGLADARGIAAALYHLFDHPLPA